MRKVCKIVSVGEIETGLTKADKRWSKISVKFSIIGGRQELIASKFEMEDSNNKIKISDVKNLTVGSDYLIDFGFGARECNGKYYLDIRLNRFSKENIENPQKYNGKNHYISGIVDKKIDERSFESGDGIDFLLLSGTGTTIPLSYFTKEVDEFNKVKNAIVEGTPITVGIGFSTNTHEDKEYSNIYVNLVRELEKHKTTQSQTTQSQTNPEAVKKIEPAESDDDLPF